MGGLLCECGLGCCGFGLDEVGVDFWAEGGAECRDQRRESFWRCRLVDAADTLRRAGRVVICLTPCLRAFLPRWSQLTSLLWVHFTHPKFPRNRWSFPLTPKHH